MKQELLFAKLIGQSLIYLMFIYFLFPIRELPAAFFVLHSTQFQQECYLYYLRMFIHLNYLNLLSKGPFYFQKLFVSHGYYISLLLMGHYPSTDTIIFQNLLFLNTSLSRIMYNFQQKLTLSKGTLNLKQRNNKNFYSIDLKNSLLY